MIEISLYLQKNINLVNDSKNVIMENIDKKNYKLLYLSLFTAASVTAFVVENFIPKPLPFLKIGLANIFILLLVYSQNFSASFIVSFFKVVIGSFFAGTLFGPTTLLAISGSFMSLLVMILLIFFKFPLSIIGISICGAVVHNISQLLAVNFLLFDNVNFFKLFPVLILFGIISGSFTGFITNLIFQKISKKDLL